MIKDRLDAKETPAAMRALLFGAEGNTELLASGQVLKEIFMEAVFSRTRKSLEHLKR